MRTRKSLALLGGALLVSLALSAGAVAQRPAPDRGPNEGEGPFQRLVIHGATLIDGDGAPPRGPVSITIQGNRITSVSGAGTPGLRTTPPPQAGEGEKVIDARGMYVLPGFVDLHVHAGGSPKAPDAEYAYKLWLAHGVTTVRGVSLGGNAAREKERSANNEIVAPRIFNYQRPSARTPEQARAWVRNAHQQGVDGMKLGAADPEIMEALLDEANRLGLGSTAHLAQTGVARMNARDASRLGLGAMTHFYGLFESLLKDHTIQPWPYWHNHSDEQHRFAQVARLWDQIHEPGGKEWNALIEEWVERGFIIDPTMTIYAAGRDVMRARNADWHEEYTLPSLWNFFEPSRRNHGSYWFYWTTHDEVAWRNFYRVWMQFLNDFKKAGGRVTTGSDSGFIYKTYGFGYIEELELLQEAGFHPLEVIRAATLHGAEALHEPKGEPVQFGIIRPGLLADLIVVPENPLQNLKVLYGTGAVRLNDETGEVERVGGIRYTIKDGIVYDARELLADVRRMVQAQKDQIARGELDPADWEFPEPCGLCLTCCGCP